MRPLTLFKITFLFTLKQFNRISGFQLFGSRRPYIVLIPIKDAFTEDLRLLHCQLLHCLELLRSAFFLIHAISLHVDLMLHFFGFLAVVLTFTVTLPLLLNELLGAGQTGQRAGGVPGRLPMILWIRRHPAELLGISNLVCEQL